MTSDAVETAAQLIHSARHRAGTGSVCGPCRDLAVRVAEVLDHAPRPDSPAVVAEDLRALADNAPLDDTTVALLHRAADLLDPEGDR